MLIRPESANSGCDASGNEFASVIEAEDDNTHCSDEYTDGFANDEIVFQVVHMTTLTVLVARLTKWMVLKFADLKGFWGKPHSFITFVLCVSGDPESFEKAVAGDNSDDWKKAMKSEFESLMVNETWVLVDLPPGRKAIPSKWVFKTKRVWCSNSQKS
ncbi:PREDICTED: uncharacterized protein LOC108373020 [Rhagoletis zephyria]|uniref:uncharacterized protein LOC108373020 n=1 Tax=Rhagoletis zephyria TaxID=28612 RepID=UPI0008118157|nr:PREDICTED: uncharacterized protein LOC108373020 [Rhagoletis zephyria]